VHDLLDNPNIETKISPWSAFGLYWGIGTGYVLFFQPRLFMSKYGMIPVHIPHGPQWFPMVPAGSEKTIKHTP